MIRVLLLALLLQAAVAAQTVKGTLTVNGKTVELTHVVGLQIPERDGDSRVKTGALILVTDREVPAKLVKPNPNPFDLRDAGVNGVKLEFYSDGGNYSMSLVGNLSSMSISMSGTFDEELFTKYEADRIELSSFTKQEELGDTNMALTVQFATDLKPYVAKPKYEPNAKDTEEAAKSPVTKAYFDFQKAVNKGDVKAMAALMLPDRAEMMLNDPDIKESLKMLKEFMATDVKALRVQVNGDMAELLLTGTMFGEPGQMGTVEFQLVNGKWLLGREKWGKNE